MRRRSTPEHPRPTRISVGETETVFGPIFLAASGRGFCRITIPGETFDELLAWLERKLPAAEIVQEQDELAVGAQAIGALLESGAPLPPLPVDLVGTAFQCSVWEAVLEIPYGQTRSYADIAGQIGYPRAARAVGAANAVNPLPFIVPCHRVVGADGSIKGFPGGIVTRRMLLDLEAGSNASPRYTDR